jgi:hypothetical protein
MAKTILFSTLMTDSFNTHMSKEIDVSRDVECSQVRSVISY